MIIIYGLCIFLFFVCIVAIIVGINTDETEILIGGAVGTLISVLLTGFCIWFFNGTAAGGSNGERF